MSISAGIAVLVFVADLLVPPGIAVGVGHVFAVLMSRRSQTRGTPYAIAGISSCLITAAFLLSPELGEKDRWKDLTNRCVVIAAAWATAVVVASRRNADRALAEMSSRMDDDWNQAHELQRRLFPDSSPDVPDLDIAGTAIPAERLCGDYFDFIRLPDESWAIAIGDVSGHGAGACLMMIELRSALRVLTESEMDVGQLLTRINVLLHRDTPTHMFVTFLLVRLEHEPGRFQFASAGQDAYLLDCSGQTIKLATGDIPLGLNPATAYRSVTPEPLKVGEILLLLTDGLTERMSPTGERLGIDRVTQVATDCRDRPASEIVQHLIAAADNWGAGRANDDDIAIVVIKRQ